MGRGGWLDATVNEAKRIMVSLRTAHDAQFSGATSSSGAGTIHVCSEWFGSRLARLKTADDIKEIRPFLWQPLCPRCALMNMAARTRSGKPFIVQSAVCRMAAALCINGSSAALSFIPGLMFSGSEKGKKVKCSSKAPKTPVAISYLSSLWNFHSGCNNNPPPPPSLRVIARLLWESERVILGCLVSFSSSSASESKEHPLGCLQEVVLYTQCRHCQPPPPQPPPPPPPSLGLLSNHMKEGFGNGRGHWWEEERYG